MLLQVSLEELARNPQVTTGVAMLIIGVLFMVGTIAIYLRSMITVFVWVFMFFALTLSILFGFDLRMFWIVSLIGVGCVLISMAVWLVFGENV